VCPLEFRGGSPRDWIRSSAHLKLQNYLNKRSNLQLDENPDVLKGHEFTRAAKAAE
jgi:hypothetical protein